MNFKIAVCDDEEIICSSLQKLLKNIADEKGIKFIVDCFLSGEELCDEMGSNAYDIVFLDIELPKKNGVAIGKYIRERIKNEAVQIVYISSKQSYAMELFEIRPINFLIKSLTHANVSKVIDKFLLLNRIDTRLFRFKKGHEFYSIPIADILYFSGSGRKIYIITLKKTYEFYGSLDNIYSEIKNNRFLFVHKSYIVNFKYIVKYEYEQAVMTDGKAIPISQSRRKAIRKDFLEAKEAELL